MADTEQNDFTSLTVDLLSAYFASNSIPSDNLAGLIRSTHDALKGLDAPAAPVEAEHVPAVSVRKSLSSPDHIISLIDGKPYKTLKRHLGTHGLTPAEYRERYKLPHDYPLVSKTYSEHRRKVAADLGLGRKVRSSTTEAEAAKPAPAKTKAAAKPRAAAAPKTKAAPVETPAAAPVKAPAAKKTAAKAAPKAASKTTEAAAKPARNSGTLKVRTAPKTEPAAG